MAAKKLPLAHPAALIATCFGLGRWRFLMPDVSGSLLAILTILIFFPTMDVHGLFACTLIIGAVGWAACGYYLHRSTRRDITEIAIDGFIGMLAAVLIFYMARDMIAAYPLNDNRLYSLFSKRPYFVLGALFLLFRFFHGWRIGLVRITSTGVRSATGIMIEALSAAMLAALVLHGCIMGSEYIRRPGVW